LATISEPHAGAPTTSSSVSTAGSWTPSNPAPLGLAGFGITTLVLSVINSNLVGAGATPVVLGLAFAFGGVAQLLAGMWEFRTGNTFGAVAFTSYGAFWISFFFLVSFDAVKIAPATEAGPGIGLYLWAWGIFTGLMFLCTFASSRALQLLFLLLTVTFILLGIGNSGGTSSMVHAGGYFGIATAAVALYIMTADVMKATYGRSVLPLGE
jgi:succinate-acetate transporter protein